eukprot:scaffold40695_cov336-Skeletonema_marinoi.AAC.2
MSTAANATILPQPLYHNMKGYNAIIGSFDDGLDISDLCVGPFIFPLFIQRPEERWWLGLLVALGELVAAILDGQKLVR